MNHPLFFGGRRSSGSLSSGGGRRTPGFAPGLAGLLGVTVLAPVAFATSGCVIVPQNRRARLADPMMALAPDSLEAHRKQKFYSTREGAAGGDGLTAGGGCACQ